MSLSFRTALHWACKRGHATIAQLLLWSGADVNIKTFKGELASELTTSAEVLAAMKIEPDENFATLCSEEKNRLPIVPNYLRNPVFPYSMSDDVDSAASTSPSASCSSDRHSTNKLKPNPETRENLTQKPVFTDPEQTTDLRNGSGTFLASEAGVSVAPPIVVRVRVSGSGESDFVEVEVPSLNYSSLLKSCCEELEVVPHEAAKIRKLPNVLIRRDKDVQRLKEGQELEIILTASE